MKEQTANLTKKYNYTPFMYIDYPHKSFWSSGFNDSEYRQALTARFKAEDKVPTMLYVHMPYCQKQCYFCTCHVVISTDYSDVPKYMEDLYKEIDLLRDHFDKNGLQPDFREIHLGGGSPTYINEKDFDQLISYLSKLTDISKLTEFSIEIDPRRVKKDRLYYYRDKGISRISFGIQDFDFDVQKAVNRVQPAKLIEDLLVPETRGLFPNGVNFDILCGLPKQTMESIKKTIEKVVELSPDRICFNYMDFAPKFAPHQLLMPQDKLPGVEDKKQLFIEAMKVLLDAGYIRTGYDHFAKPGDDVAKAMDNRKMQWNQLGYTPGRCEDTLAIGVSGSSKIGNYYGQNTYKLDEYKASVDAGKLPIFRGYHLNQDDVIRRDVIQQMRGYFSIDFKEIESKYDIQFGTYFKKELSTMGGFISDGIVELESDKLKITDIGQQFANHVCKNFDSYIKHDTYSQERVSHL